MVVSQPLQQPRSSQRPTNRK